MWNSLRLSFCVLIIFASLGLAHTRQGGDMTKFKPGTYKQKLSGEGRTTIVLTLTFTPATLGQFTVGGDLTTTMDGNVRTQRVSGRLSKSGVLRAVVDDGGESLTLNGFIDTTGCPYIEELGGHVVEMGLSPVPNANRSNPGQRPKSNPPVKKAPAPVKKTPRANQPQGLFGLVSKTVGHAPAPDEGNNEITSGSISESSFEFKAQMKPPYSGLVEIRHEYSHQLTSTLKPGDTITLTVMSSATKSGNDNRYIGSDGQWVVEGARVLEQKKAFVGFSSGGNWYGNATGVTKFVVPSSGTIRIFAAQNGAFWGSTPQWEPVIYVYKFRERPTTEPGGK